MQDMVLLMVRRLEAEVRRLAEAQEKLGREYADGRAETREELAKLRGDLRLVALQSEDRGDLTERVDQRAEKIEARAERIEERIEALEKVEARRVGVGSAVAFLVGGGGAGLVALIQWLTG